MRSKNIVKKIPTFMSAVFFALILVTPANAASKASHTQSYEFVGTSKAEYVHTVAQSEGISEEEVLKRLDAKKEAFLKKYGVPDGGISPYNFDPSHSEYMGSGVTLRYGYVTFTDTYAGNFTIQSTCPAVIAEHHYGSSFYSVETDAATSYAVGNGFWEFDLASCQAYDTSSSVTIDYNGVIDCPYDAVVSLGVSDFFGISANASFGSTYHCRTYVMNSNSYSL